MIIDGFQKLTLQDFPDNMACILFTRGCNLRCPFCQNSALVLTKEKKEGLISEDEVFAYLNKRKNILDGVVISGGEPTIQKDLKEFIKKIKDLGYKVKLDTNGTNPKLLKELIDEQLLDYCAMDIKHVESKYNDIAGVKVRLDNIKESIKLLKEERIDYEFRTTIVKEFHTIDDIKEILKLVDGSKFYIQNFEDSGSVIKDNLHGFSEDELKKIQKELKKDFNNFKVRGL